MCDLRKFREVNNLTQTELGDYIDMKKSFISKIENGKEKLPALKLQKLLSNPHGWDTSMLTSDRPSITASAAGNARVEIGSRNKNFCPGETDAASRIAVLEKEIEMLKERLKDKDGQIEFLKTLIK